MAKHIAPANFHYVSVGGEEDLAPDLPDSFLPERTSPALCRYDICELTESYLRRLVLTNLATAVPETPVMSRMVDVPFSMNRRNGSFDAPFPASLRLVCVLFRELFGEYGVSGVLGCFLDPDVELNKIAGKFSGHYVGKAVASAGVKRTTKHKYTPKPNGQYDDSSEELDPVRSHAETFSPVTVPETMPLPCLNDFTWETEVSAETVNGVEVKLPKHHLHYQFESDRGGTYGDYDTVSSDDHGAMHFMAALPLLPPATRRHKRGDPEADPDVVASGDIVSAMTALDAVELADNVSADSLHAVLGKGPMDASSTSFSVAPKPFYTFDYWTHNKLKEDYGGSDKFKESAKMFRPPGLFPTLPATYLAGEITEPDPDDSDDYARVQLYRSTWWPDPDMKARLVAAREATYNALYEWSSALAEHNKYTGIDCVVANDISSSRFAGDDYHGRSYLPAYMETYLFQGIGSYYSLDDLPFCVPDVLYAHFLKSAYNWRDRFRKTLHEVDISRLILTATETVEKNEHPVTGISRYDHEKQEGTLTYRGGNWSGNTDGKVIPGGCNSVFKLFVENGISMPAASHSVAAYDGYRDTKFNGTVDDTNEASFSGSLVFSEFTPLQDWNDCPKMLKWSRSGKSTLTDLDGYYEPDISSFSDDPIDRTDKEALVSKFIPDDRWPFIKEARLFVTVKATVFAKVGGWSTGHVQSDYTVYTKTYNNGTQTSYTGRDGNSIAGSEDCQLAAKATGYVTVDLGAIDRYTGRAAGTLDAYGILEGLGCSDPAYDGKDAALEDVLKGFGPYAVTRDGGFEHHYRNDGDGAVVTWNPPLSDGATEPPPGYTGTCVSVYKAETYDAFCGERSYNQATPFQFSATIELHKAFVAIEWDFEADGS